MTGWTRKQATGSGLAEGLTRILIIQGHPDIAGGHFCHALMAAYAEGVREGRHELREVAVAGPLLPLLGSAREWEAAEVPEAVRHHQDDIAWAEHLVIVYPLWLGSMPAVLKGFLEQVLRPGFAVGKQGETAFTKLLKGRSARIVVTMGMPALVYRWYFGAHSLKSLERNVLRFCGIGPIRESLVGMVEAGGPGRRAKWLDRMRELGRRAR